MSKSPDRRDYFTGRAKNTDAIEAMTRDPQAYFAKQTRPPRVNWKVIDKHIAAEKRRERWRKIIGKLLPKYYK